MLLLKALSPFASGGNRLCYIHPRFHDRCVKVRRPDFSLEDRRRKKGFPKNLRPLSAFDDSLEEFNVMRVLDRMFGSELYQHVSRCFGFEETDMGQGLVSELICDDNQRISQTLKKLIWDEGVTPEIERAVQAFAAFWVNNGVPSRDLLLHNIVAQRTEAGAIRRLVVIDGLGSASFIPMQWQPKFMRVAAARRKLANMRERMQALAAQRGSENFPGFHGLLLHDGNDTLRDGAKRS